MTRTWFAVGLMLVVGCPSPVSPPSSPPPAPPPVVDPVTLPSVADPCDAELEVFESKVFRPIVSTSCGGCHQPRGPAAHTRLHLVVSTAPAALRTNWLALGKFAAAEIDGASLLLLRASGEHPDGHTGGAVVPRGTPAYRALESFVADAVDPACNAPLPACTGPAYGPPMVRRLSTPAYHASIVDTFGATSTTATSLASGRAVTALVADQLRLNAESIAITVAADRDRVFPGLDDPDRFISEVGAQIYRRTLTAPEHARYVALFEATAEGDFSEGVRWVLTAMLQSPHFLYRSELGHRDGDVNRLSGPEIATALAYFLTGAPPDLELRTAALGGALVEPTERERQARRLIATPAGRAHVARFFRSWLDLDRIMTVPKDTATYPIDPTVRRDMLSETTRFVTQRLESGDTGLDGFLTADHSFVSPALAAFYGDTPVGPPDNDGWVRVETPGRRFGLLTQGSLLTVHARANDGSPIHRGKLVRERMLCQDLPSPPPGIQVEPPSTDPNLSTRERYAAHAEVEPCRSCHRLIDPIGFGFNAYDGVGRFRTEDAGRPVDASGTIVDTDHTDGDFADLAALAQTLAASPDVHACFAESLQTWAYGAAAVDGLSCALDESLGAFLGDSLRIDTLLVSLARSEHLAVRTATTP